MIPILYDSTETGFASNGIGRLRDCLSFEVTEERNGIFEADFTYPVGGANFDLIQPGRIVLATHDDTGDTQPFDIVSFSKPIDGIVTFHAVHISYRQRYLTVSGKNINSLSDAFTLLASAQPSNPFTYTASFTSSAYFAAADGVPKTVKSMLGGVEGSILDTYGGEFTWDRFNVRLDRARGQVRDFTIRYGVNLLDYTEDVDYQETYTSVIPYWTGTDSNGGQVIKVGNKTNSGFSSYTGRDECVPLDLTDKFETKPTTAQLTAEATSVMSAAQPNLPQQTIAVDFVRLQDMGEFDQFESLFQCRLCDSISVVFPEYGMQGYYKIVKTVYNVLDEKFSAMELGSLSTTLAEALGITGEGTFSETGNIEDLVVTDTLTVGGDTTIAGTLTVGGHSTPIGSTLSGTKDTTVTSLTTTVKTIATIDLPAGTWQVKGWVRFPAGTSGYRRLWVTSSSTLTSTATNACVQVTSATQTNLMNTVIASPSATTTYYLRAQASVTLSVTPSDDWSLTAVRIA